MFKDAYMLALWESTSTGMQGGICLTRIELTGMLAGAFFIEKSLLAWYAEHTDGKCPAEIILMDDLSKPDIGRFHVLENKQGD